MCKTYFKKIFKKKIRNEKKLTSCFNKRHRKKDDMNAMRRKQKTL